MSLNLQVTCKNEQFLETSSENSSTNNIPTAPESNKKKSDELIVIGNDQPSSLQESFAKFRQQKIKERQIMKISLQNALANGRTAEFKSNLRQRFIETAKRYIGVPYALRYKNPEDPIAPLYLDCCALVRQAVQDLQEDFGFVIGKWNQAYQIDTLPTSLKFEELQPGDLVFYEGEYYSNRSKKQKHNMVHVEIFLGGETGEATVGSRYHRGKVSIFPSYKFESTTWKLVNYHFRSLDTWLDGVCRSCCPEHPWNTDSLSYLDAAGKRSIFATEDVEDTAAGGDEDEEEDEKSICLPCNQQLDVGDHNSIESSMDADEEGGGDEEKVESSSGAPEGTTGETSASKGTTIAKKPKRQSPYRSVSTTQTSVNPSSSNKTANKSLESRSARSSRDRDPSVLPNTSLSYFVGKSNGWRLVKASLDRRGWTQLPFDFGFSTKFNLKWVERRSQIDYRAHQEGQLVCHIPNSDIITTKIGLLLTMRDHYCRVMPNSTALVHPPWLPETYDLESPRDITLLINETEALLSRGDPALWIYKPPCSNRGRGIKVISGIKEVKTVCYGENTGDPDTTIAPLKGIVQRYLSNPVLATDAGLKFDIRCYLLICTTHPHTLAFYHPGYCRLALHPYSLDLSSIGDSLMHLTNASIQKKGDGYEESKDIQIQSIASLVTDFRKRGDDAVANYVENSLDHDIKRCMADVLKACNGKFLKRHGFFDLLGCDFMLENSSSGPKLQLLEVNTNPAMSLDNSVLEGLLPAVIDGTLELVLATQGPGIEIDSVKAVALPYPLPGLFQPVFDEERHWSYE